MKNSEKLQIEYLDKLSTNLAVRNRIAVLALKQIKNNDIATKALSEMDKVFSEMDRK